MKKDYLVWDIQAVSDYIYKIGIDYDEIYDSEDILQKRGMVTVFDVTKEEHLSICDFIDENDLRYDWL